MVSLGIEAYPGFPVSAPSMTPPAAPDEVQRLIALAVQEERAACALAAENCEIAYWKDYTISCLGISHESGMGTRLNAARAIRARGKA